MTPSDTAILRKTHKSFKQKERKKNELCFKQMIIRLINSTFDLIWADYRGKKLVQNLFTLQVDRDDDDGIILFLVFFPPISTENLKRNHLHFSLTFRTDVCRHRRSCTVKDAHSFDT